MLSDEAQTMINEMLLSGFREHSFNAGKLGRWVIAACLKKDGRCMLLTINPQRGWRWVRVESHYGKHDMVEYGKTFSTDDKALRDYLGKWGRREG